mgnify:CR=1 FL=1
MSGFDAFNSVQPQKNPKCFKLRKSRQQGYYFWAAVILLCIIIFLFINHFVMLRSYNRLKNDLVKAYTKLNDQVTTNNDLVKNEKKLKKENDELTAELIQLKEKYSQTSRGTEDLLKQLDDLKRSNAELAEKVKELTNDNIALQNSLKMAASVGVKPQSYTLFEGLEQRDTLDRGEYLGKFLGTAYTPSKEECGNDLGITKSGEPIIPGVSIAVDERYWPFGTVFYIKGLGYTVAMDTGSAVKGKYRFDFSVLDRNFALQLGSRKWDVYLVKMGDGNVKDIKL